MIAKVRKTLIILCCLAVLAPLSASADGMVVPPKDYWVQETGQKAVIFYDQGVETMVVSISFKGNAEDFGWVIPVPSKPEVNKGSDELFTSLNELTEQFYDHPMYGRDMLEKSAASGVTVIETKKIDYYDVTILSSTDEDALIDWLQQNNYNFPSSASYILNSYIQNDWYFVAMRVNTKSADWPNITAKLRSGHATPVAITFETENIVYPLKISSVTSRESENAAGAADANADIDSAAAYTAGKINNGIELDNNGAVSFEADDFFNASEGTVEMWIKPDASWSTASPGYWELFTVAANDGSDVLEFRAGQDSNHDNLQFIAYNPSYTVWKTTDQVELIWDHTQWYYVAVTWSADNSPQIYINGIAQTMEASYSGNSWIMRSAEGGTVYLNQRKSYWGSNSGRAVFDEVRISNARKTAEEISAAYYDVLSNKAFEVEGDTLLLAHFDDNLLEEKTGEYLAYNNITSAVAVKKTASPVRYDPGVGILLYVFADHKKTLPDFSTDWANWVKKDAIKELALDDQGNPWIEPSKGKYFLTRLSASMQYADMTDDLFFRDADNNKKVGAGTGDWGKLKSNLGPLILFFIISFALITLASIFSPYGVLFIAGVLFHFLSKNKTVHTVFWVLQSVAIFLYVVTVLLIMFAPFFGDSVWESLGSFPLYSLSSDTRAAVGFLIILMPIVIVILAMIAAMVLQARHHHRRQMPAKPLPLPPTPTRKVKKLQLKEKK